MNRKIMNKNCFFVLLLITAFFRSICADELSSNNGAADVGGAGLMSDVLSPIALGDATKMLRNMTPEQRKEFNEYIRAMQDVYEYDNSMNLVVPEKEEKAFSHTNINKKAEEGFLVEEPVRLLSFADIVGGVPDGVLLTAKALQKKRSGGVAEGNIGGNKRRKNAAYRLLLYGPPGTGKTTLAEAFTREIGAKFMRVKGTAFIDGYIATGTDRIHKLFEKARGLGESVVVFIDEVDAIGRERTKERNDEYANTLVALIQELDQCEREAADRVFVILATNKFSTLDEALRSRFSSTAIEIKAPSSDLGQQIMQYYLNDYEHERLTKPTLWWIKFWTRGFSGRDYESMINKAYVLAGENKITKNHILKAMNEVCAARASGENEKDSWFKKFTEKYSSPWSTTMSAITYTSSAVGAACTLYYFIQSYIKKQTGVGSVVPDAVQAQIADATRPLLVMIGQLMTEIAGLKAGKPTPAV